MSDLFTTLAQGQTDSGEVQPRLPARFEDNTLEEAVETEERPLPYQPDNPVQVDAMPQPQVTNPAAGSHVAQVTAGIETVIETVTETAGNRMPARDGDLPITPGQAPRSAAAGQTPRPPAVGQQPAPTPARLAASTVRPPSPVPDQESSPFDAVQPETAGKPADAAVSPATSFTPDTLMAAVDTIRAAGVDVTPNIEPQPLQPLEIERQASRDAVQPQVMPISSAPEIGVAGAGPHPGSEPPIIEVHIGRVELRRVAPQTPDTPPARSRFEPPVSLGAYLNKRSGGRE